MPQEVNRGVETVTPVYYSTEGHFRAKIPRSNRRHGTRIATDKRAIQGL